MRQDVNVTSERLFDPGPSGVTVIQRLEVTKQFPDSNGVYLLRGSIVGQTFCPHME